MDDFSLNLNGIIAILAILTTVTVAYFANWWRNRKSLAYEVVSNTPLLTMSEEVKDKIQILYENKPVKNVHLLVVKVINDGRQPIDDKDFKKPLDFIFVEGTQILSVEVLSVKPDNLKVSTNYEANKFTIEPIMLNNKDFIEIKSVISARKIEFKPDARIVGVSKINQQTDLSSLKSLLWSLSYIPSLIVMVILYYSGHLNTMVDFGIASLPDFFFFHVFTGVSVAMIIIIPTWTLAYYITLFCLKYLRK